MEMVDDQLVHEQQQVEEEEELDYHMIDELQQHNIKFFLSKGC
jgi:hypothetical protein